MNASDEHRLTLRARQGDRGAFGELVRLHQAAVFNVAYRLLGSPHDAEDAAQETFIRAYKYFSRFDPGRPLGPWLRKIAANVCFKRLSEIPADSTGLDPDDGWSPPATDPSPEVGTLIRERDRRLREEILRLPPRFRLVIELRHFQELSYEEIAEALGRPLSDVKSDLFRARRMLAERLSDMKYEPPH
jgi:RNA polymerase sigma-70 factor (ECF subfamily)